MISVQTGSQTKTVGEAVSLTVQASGSGVLSYSWRKNGVPVLNGGGVEGEIVRCEERHGGIGVPAFLWAKTQGVGLGATKGLSSLPENLLGAF